LKLIHFRTYIVLASTRLWHQLLSHGTQYVWKFINIYSTSVRFWGINLVAEIHVAYRTALSFHITTNIMLHAFLLFTQTQWNKDIYTIRVDISGYHFNDRYQRYMKICNPQRAVFGVSFSWRRLGNEISLHWQTHISFYWQKLSINKNICCTKIFVVWSLVFQL
jgi:hypothetical protein